MIAALRRMMADENGAAIAEYGMIAAGVAVPFIAVALAISATAGNTLGATTAGMQTVGVNPP
jgi:Flp pilus assembly pilin Flp